MNALDLILIVFFVIGMASGYRKGFLVSLFSLLAIFLGIIVSFKFMGAAMLTLNDHYNIDEKILPYVAFAVVFILVLIAVNLLGKLFKSSLDKTLLGSIDQLAGAVLGILKTAFMISVIFWILESMEVDFLDRWKEDSWAYTHVATVAPAVTAWVGGMIPEIGDLFQPTE